MIYVIVLNSILVLWTANIVTSSIAYPISNCFFRRSINRQTNTRFSLEFNRCVERMTKFIEETTLRQN